VSAGPALAPQRAWSAPARILRRLEWLAGGYGLAGAAWLLLFRDSASAALVLTLTAVASIVSFRGLQGLVGQLQAGIGRPESRTSDTRRSSARRSRRLVWLRFSLLTLAPLTSLWMDSERALALILGFSVLPLAIMTEGLLQLVFVLGEHDHGD
jgi:hypothetical protein